MSAAEEVLSSARRAYDIATTAWYREREQQGIVELDPMVPEESDEIAKGRKYRTTSPVAATVMLVWQKCKAELDHAAANHRRELGDTTCATCPAGERGGVAPAPAALPDPRLPPERDDMDAEPL